LIKALVFDFDGLILDTESAEYASWCEIFAEHGRELRLEEWSVGIGTQKGFDPYGHLEALIGRPVVRDEIHPRMRARLLDLVAQEVVKPGVVSYLDDAARLDLKIGLASSADRDWVTGHLSRLGLLDRFHTIQCWGEGLRPKPAPDLYLAAVKALGVEPREAIALEDSPNGLAAARAAGLYCVAVPSGPTKALDFSQADLILPSLADLPLEEVLARANARSH
jgi:beta-phosphoglucomutase-like phosphatase (HAD superfamily)